MANKALCAGANAAVVGSSTGFSYWQNYEYHERNRVDRINYYENLDRNLNQDIRARIAGEGENPLENLQKQENKIPSLDCDNVRPYSIKGEDGTIVGYVKRLADSEDERLD